MAYVLKLVKINVHGIDVWPLSGCSGSLFYANNPTLKNQTMLIGYFMNHSKALVATSVLSLSLLFLGCATTVGNQNLTHMTSSDISSHIIKGKSTKADVTAYLGEPMSKYTNGGSEYWSYAYTKASGNGMAIIPFVGFLFERTAVNSTGLQVEFTLRGIVRDYSTSQTAMNVH